MGVCGVAKASGRHSREHKSCAEARRCSEPALAAWNRSGRPRALHLQTEAYRSDSGARRRSFDRLEGGERLWAAGRGEGRGFSQADPVTQSVGA